MPPQRKQRENRRRTGCFQCKAKHVQCTEERSQCRRCVRLGLKCERGLKLIFREDAVQRRICFGREGTWRKRPGSDKKTTITEAGSGSYSISLNRYRGRWIFLNTKYGDFLPPTGNVEGPDTGTDQSTLSLQVTTEEKSQLLLSQPWEHPLTSYSEIERYLLDYFIRGIAPSCSLSPSGNPYISLITPLCFIHTTLRDVLLAVAANQLRLLGDTRFIKEACIFKDRALQGLQRAMASNSFDYGVIATVLMLCFFDISDSCDPSWLAHLRGGLELISRPLRDCTESDSLESFFTMYFVAHDIMRRASRNRLQDESSTGVWLKGDDMDEIDTVMGCSRQLMSLIDTISNLASRRTGILVSRVLTSSETEEFASAFNHTENSLHTLKQCLPKHSEGQYHLTQIAETKRLAALLYLAERADPEAPAQLEADLDRSGVTRDTTRQVRRRDKKRRLISSIINTVSTLPDSATLLWPLFVVGNSGLENEEERRFVLDRLGRMQKTRNLGSVRRARKAVKRAFCISDLGHANVCGQGQVWVGEGCGFISLA